MIKPTPQNLETALSTLSESPPGQWVLLLYEGETINSPTTLMDWCRYRSQGFGLFELSIRTLTGKPHYEVRLVPSGSRLNLTQCLQPDTILNAPWEPRFHRQQLAHIWIESGSFGH